MSGIDPTLAAALDAAVLAVESAVADAALSLGSGAPPLQEQVSVGDVLPALILPPQNGQDLIQISGQTAVAQLPPDVHPGETILLEVTGFEGDQILVRNLGPAPPENSAGVAPADPAVAPEPGTAVPAAQDSAPAAAAAPPREFFVMASVRPAPPPVQPSAQQPPQSALEQSVLPQNIPGKRIASVDARIAAAQTARMAVRDAVAATFPKTLPPIVVAPAKQSPAYGTRTHSTDLLRAVRLPETAFTRTVAAIAGQAPQRLAPVLARLDQALVHVAGDARAATLRTIAAFTSRLNLANEETLPAQIAAFVSHVLEGAEVKIVQLLKTYAQASAQPQTQAPSGQAQPAQEPAARVQIVAQEPQPSATPHAASQPATGANGQTQAAVPAPHAIAQAQAAHRAAGLDYELKSLVLSLLRDPPAGRTPALTQALNETLITLTGTQLNALGSNAQNANTIALPLPAYFHEGGKPAFLRISRDADGSARPVDADTFHVAFVLDTANLGTVAIDLVSSGRTVKVDVKTEAAAAASRFSQTLDALRERLEKLRYRVASAKADVAALQSQSTAPVVPAPQDVFSRLDLRA